MVAPTAGIHEVRAVDDDCICAYLVIVRGFWICSFKISDAMECPLAELGRCNYARGPFKPELND